jgi:hypothetical protein
VQPNGRRRVEHVVVCPVWEVPSANERFSRNMIGNLFSRPALPYPIPPVP